MSELEVDCVIPTHGRPQHLAEALRSVTTQVARPGRILVVSDDGDPDSREVVARAQAAHPALDLVFLVRTDGAPGASASRNLGAAAGQAPLIAFLDDDDRWEPDYLARAVQVLRATRADAMVTATQRLGPAGLGFLKVPEAGLTARDVFRSSPGVTGSNLLVRRTAFTRVGGFDPALPVQNDRDLFLRLLESGCRYAVQPQRMVLVGEHGGDRLTRASGRRADGVLLFLAKHGARYSWWDRRVHRYVAHYTRLSAAQPRAVLLRSLVGTLANWSPTAGRDLPLWRHMHRVGRLVKAVVRAG